MRIAIVALLFASSLAQTWAASLPPALQSQSKQFTVEVGSLEAYMCQVGRLQAVLATSLYGTVVDTTLLDAQKNAIPANTWTEAAGFRLSDKPRAAIHVTMTCGN